MQTNYWPRGLCIYLTSAVSKEIFYEHLNSLIPNFFLDKREPFQRKLPLMDVKFTQAGIYEVTRTLSNQCFRVSVVFFSWHVLKYKLPIWQCIHIIKQNSNWQNFSKGYHLTAGLFFRYKFDIMLQNKLVLATIDECRRLFPSSVPFLDCIELLLRDQNRLQAIPQ